jgi:hypothetical protein
VKDICPAVHVSDVMLLLPFLCVDSASSWSRMLGNLSNVKPSHAGLVAWAAAVGGQTSENMFICWVLVLGCA